MQTSTDPVFGQARKYMDGRIEAAANGLHDEFVSAFETGPQTPISTPGFFNSTNKLDFVVADSFAGIGGEWILSEMISIIGQAMKQGGALGERAEKLVKAMANEHANFHAEDAA